MLHDCFIVTVVLFIIYTINGCGGGSTLFKTSEDGKSEYTYADNTADEDKEKINNDKESDGVKKKRKKRKVQDTTKVHHTNSTTSGSTTSTANNKPGDNQRGRNCKRTRDLKQAEQVKTLKDQITLSDEESQIFDFKPPTKIQPKTPTKKPETPTSKKTKNTISKNPKPTKKILKDEKNLNNEGSQIYDLDAKHLEQKSPNISKTDTQSDLKEEKRVSILKNKSTSPSDQSQEDLKPIKLGKGKDSKKATLKKLFKELFSSSDDSFMGYKPKRKKRRSSEALRKSHSSSSHHRKQSGHKKHKSNSKKLSKEKKSKYRKDKGKRGRT